jgi:cysteine desulfurase
VLLAMGATADRARASIRISLGKQNTDEEVDLAIGLIPETVARLRELSPVWKAAVST